MYFKNHFSMIVGLIVMLVLGFAMAIVALTVNGAPLSFTLVFKTGATAFTLNIITAIVFPAGGWGEAACKKCGFAPGSAKQLLLSVLILTAVYVTSVSIFMTALEVGFGEVFLMAWLAVYPWLFVSGYIVAVLVSLVAVRIAAEFAKP